MYRLHPLSEQKPRGAKVKVRDTDPKRSQIMSFPVTDRLLKAVFKAQKPLPHFRLPFFFRVSLPSPPGCSCSPRQHWPSPLPLPPLFSSSSRLFLLAQLGSRWKGLPLPLLASCLGTSMLPQPALCRISEKGTTLPSVSL